MVGAVRKKDDAADSSHQLLHKAGLELIMRELADHRCQAVFRRAERRKIEASGRLDVDCGGGLQVKQENVIAGHGGDLLLPEGLHNRLGN